MKNMLITKTAARTRTHISMDKIRHRIADESGASILIALMLALVCAMIAVIIVSAAGVNAEKSQRHIKEEQAYLNLASAAQAINTEFTTDQDLKVSVNSGNVTINPGKLGTSGLTSWLLDQSTAIVNSKASGGTPNLTSKTVDIQAPNPYNKNNTGLDAKADFTMDEYFNITVKVHAATDNAREAYANELQVVIEANQTTSTTEPSGIASVTWASSTPISSNAATYLANANTIWDSIKEKYTGKFSSKQTLALLKLYLESYPTSPLSSYEKTLAGISSTDYGWKPIVTDEEQVVLVACTNSTGKGDGYARNAVLLYFNGTYYRAKLANGEDATIPHFASGCNIDEIIAGTASGSYHWEVVQ